METQQQSYKQQLLGLLNSLPEEEQEIFAKKIILEQKPDRQPEPEIEAAKDEKPRYSQTVLDAIRNHKGPSLMEFLLENRLELPDDIDFSRAPGGAREIEF